MKKQSLDSPIPIELFNLSLSDIEKFSHQHTSNALRIIQGCAIKTIVCSSVNPPQGNLLENCSMSIAVG